jgi:phenylpropionate dioxygenase-like ring-hydroxylating dioxygenase large terminal subunit
MQGSLFDSVNAQPRGRPLSRWFYNSKDLWDFEERTILSTAWSCVAHICEFSNTKNCLVRRIGSTSILITRDNDNKLHGVLNICAHRGSQLIDEDSLLTKQRIVCPYHGWTYLLNGNLSCVRGNQNTANSNLGAGLRKVAVKQLNGLIFVRISQGGDSAFYQYSTNFKPYLDLHGVQNAVIVSRRKYPINANWKLVVENFRECLHCVSSHPSYCHVYEYPNIHEYQGDQACIDRTLEWGHKKSAKPELAGAKKWFEKFISESQPHYAMRRQIGADRLSLTQDGSPASKLMGEFINFDGGDTVLCLHPFCSLWCANDYFILFRFVPLSVQTTYLELTWFVDGVAHSELAYDRDKLEWLWHNTTIEDVELIERAQRGIDSVHFRPGYFTEQEEGLRSITTWYLDFLRHELSLEASRNQSKC